MIITVVYVRNNKKTTASATPVEPLVQTSNPEVTTTEVITTPEKPLVQTTTPETSETPEVITNPEVTTTEVITNPEVTTTEVITNPAVTTTEVITTPEVTTPKVTNTTQDPDRIKYIDFTSNQNIFDFMTQTLQPTAPDAERNFFQTAFANVRQLNPNNQYYNLDHRGENWSIIQNLPTTKKILGIYFDGGSRSTNLNYEDLKHQGNGACYMYIFQKPISLPVTNPNINISVSVPTEKIKDIFLGTDATDETVKNYVKQNLNITDLTKINNKASFNKTNDHNLNKIIDQPEQDLICVYFKGGTRDTNKASLSVLKANQGKDVEEMYCFWRKNPSEA